MATVTICNDFGAPSKIKSFIVSIVSPSVCYEMMGPDAMNLVFWMLSFEPVSLIHDHIRFQGCKVCFLCGRPWPEHKNCDGVNVEKVGDKT